jgi:hypothetical protein
MTFFSIPGFALFIIVIIGIISLHIFIMSKCNHNNDSGKLDRVFMYGVIGMIILACASPYISISSFGPILYFLYTFFDPSIIQSENPQLYESIQIFSTIIMGIMGITLIVPIYLIFLVLYIFALPFILIEEASIFYTKNKYKIKKRFMKFCTKNTYKIKKQFTR